MPTLNEELARARKLSIGADWAHGEAMRSVRGASAHILAASAFEAAAKAYDEISDPNWRAPAKDMRMWARWHRDYAKKIERGESVPHGTSANTTRSSSVK